MHPNSTRYKLLCYNKLETIKIQIWKIGCRLLLLHDSSRKLHHVQHMNKNYGSWQIKAPLILIYLPAGLFICGVENKKLISCNFIHEINGVITKTNSACNKQNGDPVLYISRMMLSLTIQTPLKSTKYIHMAMILI